MRASFADQTPSYWRGTIGVPVGLLLLGFWRFVRLAPDGAPLPADLDD